MTNVWANRQNLSANDGIAVNFSGLPLHRLAYVHVACGEFRADGQHDTGRAAVAAELTVELDEIAAVIQHNSTSENTAR